MKLKIITPERVVLEESVEAVYANTIDGEVGILPKHIPLISPLAVGILRYVQQGKKEPVAVMGGLLRTNGEDISVLSNAAEKAVDIDVLRAEQAKVRAEQRLQIKNNDIDHERAQSALSRSLTRLKIKQTLS